MNGLLECSMCGLQFDPAEHVACRSCPLQKGCQLVCCPSCGFEMVNPERSALARLAARWIRGRRHVADHAVADVLTDVRPGREVRLTGFAQVMPRERWAHLQAYGLTPGCSVRVVQHTPITVVQIGHLELALEADLARQIQVEAVLTGRSG